jgi:hypothetical protein
MRFSEIIFVHLNERQQQRTEIMYHGTSTNLVRSILKNGLLATPPKKTYSADTYGASTESMGGVYVAHNREFAETIADEAVGSHGGEKALVTIQYVKGSADIDEDDLVAAISRASQKVMVTMSEKAPARGKEPRPFSDDPEPEPDRYSDLSYPHQGWAADQMIKNIDDAATKITYETMRILNRQSQTRKAAEPIIKQMAIKLLQNAGENDDARDRWNAIQYDAYETFRETMEDLLAKLMRQVSPDVKNHGIESGKAARRIDRDVKFKGKTRILQIESPIGKVVYPKNNKG